MATISDRIRAMAVTNPELSHSELARRCGASSCAVVSQIIGPAVPKNTRPPEPPARFMKGDEFKDCLRRVGVSPAWLANWLGVTSSCISNRISGKVSIQPAEAVLIRFLAAYPEELSRVVELSEPTMPDIMPLIRLYCVKPKNSDGGALRIVLNDGKVSDADIKFCLGRAAVLGDHEAVYIAKSLLRISRSQRASVVEAWRTNKARRRISARRKSA